MIGEILKKNDIIIYESTVYPGCTEEECVPILEKESSLIFNKDFFCGYSRESITQGDKLNTIEANARQQMRRACKVNVAYAYARHKTIEFRHHSGTTDYNKIANWIEFLQYFVAQSIKIKQAIKISHNYKPRKKNVRVV